MDNKSENLESFKTQVEQCRAGRRRVMWPAAIKARVRALMASGLTTTEIHNATGISFSALHAWTTKPKFKEMRVNEVAEQSAVTLRLSSKGLDVEIENLSTSAVVDILARFI